MSSQKSSTPVKVPPTAANYTPATLDPDLRSQLNMLLLRDGHVAKIQEHLLHTLHSEKSNWPTQVQDHALHLLRTGEITTFPDLLRRVLEDVRQDTLAGSKSSSKANGESNKKGAVVNGITTLGSNLAIPKEVVTEALKVTKDCLEAVCEVEVPGA